MSNAVEVQGTLPAKPKLKAGQLWMLDDGDVFILCRYNSSTRFGLFSLEDGNVWSSAGATIDGVFGGEAARFTLLTSPVIITPQP